MHETENRLDDAGDLEGMNGFSNAGGSPLKVVDEAFLSSSSDSKDSSEIRELKRLQSSS